MIARHPAVLLTAVILLTPCVLASLFADSSRIPAGQVTHYLLHLDASSVSYNINILRMQHTVMDILVGAALVAAGVVMQAVARNPPVEPGLLDVSAGTSPSIVLGTVMFDVPPISDQLALAAGGALVAAILAQVIDVVGASSSSPVRLVFVGVAFSVFTRAVIRGAVLTIPNLFRTSIDWKVGSLTRTDIPLLPVVAPVVAGIGTAILLADTLDNVALGDDAAAVLGTQAALVRSPSLVTVTALYVTATIVIGPTGLADLMAPLTASWPIGPHRGWAVALHALNGSVVVPATDVLGRVLARPGEVQVGLLTTLVGPPVLLLMALWVKNRAS